MSDSKKKGFGFNRTDIKKEEKNNIAIQRNAIKKSSQLDEIKRKSYKTTNKLTKTLSENNCTIICDFFR